MELLRAPSLRAPHGFSTRHGGVSMPPFDSMNLSLRVGDDSKLVATNRTRLSVAAGDEVHTAHQVHGTRIATVAELQAGPSDEADGLWSCTPGEIVGVYIADCLPVLIEDVQTGSVAAVHAGWKGLIAGVVENAIATLVARGSREADLRFALGPCIRKCCFVVDAELAKRFEDTYGLSVVTGRNVDLPQALALALQRRGLALHEDIGRCTSCEPATFFSHRRDKGRTGRHVAFIQCPLKPPGS